MLGVGGIIQHTHLGMYVGWSGWSRAPQVGILDTPPPHARLLGAPARTQSVHAEEHHEQDADEEGPTPAPESQACHEGPVLGEAEQDAIDSPSGSEASSTEEEGVLCPDTDPPSDEEGVAATASAGAAAEAALGQAGCPLVYVHRRYGTILTSVHRQSSAVDYDIRPDYNLPGLRCKMCYGREINSRVCAECASAVAWQGDEATCDRCRTAATGAQTLPRPPASIWCQMACEGGEQCWFRAGPHAVHICGYAGCVCAPPLLDD